LLTRHTGLLTQEIWQRQFAPLLAKARSNTAGQPEVEKEVEREVKRQVQESKP
ncbi:DsbE family thiol:disulfide interchange protein, partial [Aeromonas caviae]|nr:DsbE family thiol:disulfide interchange protein [Aeromonas caviae]MCX4110222.1 DsbE family thiol:disulfide interchange protein [Aeromonas caviae]